MVFTKLSGRTDSSTYLLTHRRTDPNAVAYAFGTVFQQWRRHSWKMLQLAMYLRHWMLSDAMPLLTKTSSLAQLSQLWQRLGDARILLQGGTGTWRTGSEVRGDKVVQNW